jgi:hypothetical protein
MDAPNTHANPMHGSMGAGPRSSRGSNVQPNPYLSLGAISELNPAARRQRPQQGGNIHASPRINSHEADDEYGGTENNPIRCGAAPVRRVAVAWGSAHGSQAGLT